MEELQQLERAVEQHPGQVEPLNRLLEKYPLLYGYWLRLTAIDPSEWPAALAAAPSVPLWKAYLDTEAGSSESAAWEAVGSVGRDFQADPLWERLLSRTADREAVLKQVVRIPLYEYNKYAQIAQKELDINKEVYDDTRDQVASRWSYEQRIQRNYFHVLPVDMKELQAWDEYLQFEEMQGNSDQIRALYKRCLTVTALYPGFWMQYLRWLSMEGTAEEIESAFDRALHHNPNNTQLTKYRAQLREVGGNIDGARSLWVQLGGRDLQWFEERQGERAGIQGDSIEAWRSGNCLDPVALVDQLKADGRLAEFFEVDAKSH